MEKKRGSTLAELVIVMAVVSVMSVMVVSFSILCNGWVKIGIQRYRLAQDQRTISNVLHEYVEALDSDEYYFSNFNGKELAVRSHSDISLAYNLTYDSENGVIHCVMPDKEATYPVDHISFLSFYIRNAGNEGKQLICCTVHYILPAVNGQKEELVGTFDIVIATRSAGI